MLNRVHAKDCKDCAEKDGMVDRIERVIHLEGKMLTDEHRQILLNVANKCPVHKTLESKTHIVTSTK
jgi:uncharacterized OsmC-like protein